MRSLRGRGEQAWSDQSHAAHSRSSPKQMLAIHESRADAKKPPTRPIGQNQCTCHRRVTQADPGHNSSISGIARLNACCDSAQSEEDCACLAGRSWMSLAIRDETKKAPAIASGAS